MAIGWRGLIVPLAALIAVGAAGTRFIASSEPDQPCPAGARTIHVARLHFQPGVVEHQNWAEISPSDITLGERIYLCTDGVLVGSEHMEQDDLEAQSVILRIPTRWVDVTWAAGRLDQYRDPQRWTVVFASADRRE